jgi:hypothetical protein
LEPCRPLANNSQKPKPYEREDVAVSCYPLNFKARPHRQRIEIIDTRMRIVALQHEVGAKIAQQSRFPEPKRLR